MRSTALLPPPRHLNILRSPFHLQVALALWAGSLQSGLLLRTVHHSCTSSAAQAVCQMRQQQTSLALTALLSTA
jgi:hypothetical protein